MPISGDIDSGYALGNPTYNGQFCMVGADGNHYVAWRIGGVFPNPAPSILIAQFESGVTSSTVIDFTSFTNDLVAFGVSIAGLPYGGFFVCTEVPLKGTPYMWVLGNSDISNSATQFPVAGVLYRIDGPDTFTPIHYYHMICSTMDKAPSITRDLHCAANLNSQSYSCVACGQINLFSETHNTRLIGPLPIDTDIVDMTPSSWDPFSMSLPFAETLAGIGNLDLLQGTNMSITQGNGGIAVFWPRSSTDWPFTIVASNGTNSGETNIASLFGLPFADEGLNWQGVASGNQSDTYWRAPNVEEETHEIIFARGFTDSGTEGYRQMRLIRFFWDNTTNTPTLIDQTDFQYRTPTDLTFTPRYGCTQREASDNINVAMGYIGEFWKSGFITTLLSPGDEPPALDDEDDVRGPCDFTWDQCALIPENICVDLVSPTVSAGRSLNNREQVVQPDAGSWHILYDSVPVRTRYEVLLWRHYESTANGRAGVICVPVYEGKLSSTPIAASASGDFRPGIVLFHLTQTAGATIRAGMHFNAGEWLYRVKAIIGTSAGITTLKITPPLRESVADLTVLNFNTPTCRCRLAADNEMDLTLEILRYGKKSINFGEDV